MRVINCSTCVAVLHSSQQAEELLIATAVAVQALLLSIATCSAHISPGSTAAQLS